MHWSPAVPVLKMRSRAIGPMPVRLLGLVLGFGLVACSSTARLPLEAGTGAHPDLPAPVPELLPTVVIPRAVGWPPEVNPLPAPGMQVQAFARGLEHPRWLHVLPNGDVLVAETNAAPRRDEFKGLRGRMMQRAMKKAGAAAPNANRISLLRDADGDGIAETRSVFLQDLNSPFGMALVGKQFYVANTDAVLRFPYETGQLQINAPGTRFAELPAGRLNHHWTKSLVASPDGRKLYVGVGSNSNIAEKGMALEQGRAAIWEIDTASGAARVYATGLRNPVGMAWEPESGALWVAVNERDELGSDLVPDYMTALREGAFYGWPYSYYGQHVDVRVQPQDPDLVASAITPDYALGPHTASLGLASAAGSTLPEPFTQGMFVGQHGSWNRDPPSGYKVIFVPFARGRPAGPPLDVLIGFLRPTGETYGRPVGVAIDRRGALLVADDVGNVVWRVSRAALP
jgi:glucose/arabinose dehydrogenase